MSISVEDRLAIGELLSRAAYGYDERDVDTLSACFAEGASMTIRIAGGDPVGPFKGREDIMGLMTSSMASQTDVRRHVISNLFFQEDGDTPLVVTNLTLLATESGAIDVISAGIYRDRVVREDGAWKISDRQLDLDKGY